MVDYSEDTLFTMWFRDQKLWYRSRDSEALKEISLNHGIACCIKYLPRSSLGTFAHWYKQRVIYQSSTYTSLARLDIYKTGKMVICG